MTIKWDMGRTIIFIDGVLSKLFVLFYFKQKHMYT